MKKRLDVLVAEQEGISREKAQALIMAGDVLVEGKQVTKSGQSFADESLVEIKEKFPFVSRGALKLKEAINEFKIDFSEKVIADVGASTGGFTDFSLQADAKKVYAVDTGKGQIAQKLRENQKVVLFENTNIKDIERLPEKIDYFVVDVSFISLKKVFPALYRIDCNASVIALVKPQFEVGKEIADKTKGIIRDKDLQLGIVAEIGSFAESLGYKVQGITKSPITGAKGNIEFLILLEPQKNHNRR